MMPGMKYLCYFACFVTVLALLVPFVSAVTTSDLLYSTYFQGLSRVCYRDCSVSSSQCSCQVLDRVTGLDFPGEVILYRSQDWHSTSLRQLIEPLVKKSAECLKSCSLSMYYKKGCALHSCPWYECAQSCISDYKTSVNTVISQAVSSTQTSTRTNIIPP